MSAGKGSRPRPLSVTKQEFNKRFDMIDWSDGRTKRVRCPQCKRDVTPYVRHEGEQWCPWCSIKIQREDE